MSTESPTPREIRPKETVKPPRAALSPELQHRLESGIVYIILAGCVLLLVGVAGVVFWIWQAALG